MEMHIILKGDGILEGFPEEKVIHVTSPITVTSLAGGMQSGLPSVSMIIDLPDGRKVHAETSLKLFLAAAAAFSKQYIPDDENFYLYAKKL